MIGERLKISGAIGAKGVIHALTFSIILQLLGDDKRSADDANAYAILDLIDALIQNSHRFVQFFSLKMSTRSNELRENWSTLFVKQSQCRRRIFSLR